MSKVMTRIYLECVTTDDAFVRLILLQLVEFRARRWRQDSAAVNFYANRMTSCVCGDTVDTFFDPGASRPVYLLMIVNYGGL
jgi:hypothetical protein